MFLVFYRKVCSFFLFVILFVIQNNFFSVLFEDMLSNTNHAASVTMLQMLMLENDSFLLAQEEEENVCFISTIEEYKVDSRFCVDNDKTTFWLKYTQWFVQFANRPLDILSASVL